ncbi:FAD:protein FMN transferase [Marinoscillum sp. MHG1-6]|uniref:FAD:protein FMN transferase n=1 Tax=Marinoscillum sp. MHG1-6 TaxID=2959627 RepID=UPI0021580C66|nr:FAD:protein FMN transferase [Marinoscillum sp. MHG1-6]
MTTRKIFFRGIVLIVVLGALYRVVTSSKTSLFHITGQTMGTISYNVKYLSEDKVVKKGQIDSLLRAFNQSLSTYIPNSEISTLNNTGTLDEPSQMFRQVLNKSQVINDATNGAFDPTVGPLVGAWGFGADKALTIPDSNTVKSLLSQVGFARISFDAQKVTMDTSMYLDFSAIAKGYAVDLVGELLDSRGISNYLVEIGGEVSAKGLNDKEKIWSIGIEDPMVEMDERKLLAIVHLDNLSLATSGNYRNYYKVGDRIVAHTIDPRTGYNTNHNLLSASVFAADCMTADAFATAFMVIGKDSSISLVEALDIEAFLIYQKPDGTLSSYTSEGLQPLIEMNKLDE